MSDLLAEQKRRCYALDQLVARLPHFAYQDAQDLLGKASEMSERLKEKLKAAELAARTAGEQHKQIAQRHTEALQLRTALDSSASAKRQTLNEFEQELAAMGLTLSDDMEEKSRAHKKEIEELLIRTRSRRTSAEAQLQVTKRENRIPWRSSQAGGQGLFQRPQIPGGPQGELVAGGAAGT